MKRDKRKMRANAWLDEARYDFDIENARRILEWVEEQITAGKY